MVSVAVRVRSAETILFIEKRKVISGGATMVQLWCTLSAHCDPVVAAIGRRFIISSLCVLFAAIDGVSVLLSVCVCVCVVCRGH